MRKLDASKWAYKVEAQIETGSYLNAKTRGLTEIKLSELLNFMKAQKIFSILEKLINGLIY